MDIYKKMSYRRGNRNYQLVLIPKKKMKVVFIGGSLRRYLGNFLYEPAKQKSIIIVEGNLLDGSIERYSLLGKKSVRPRVVGYLKGKGTLEISRDFRRNLTPAYENGFSAKNHYVSVMDSANRWSAKSYSDDYEAEEAYLAQPRWI
jgi:hypothetical protein